MSVQQPHAKEVVQAESHKRITMQKNVKHGLICEQLWTGIFPNCPSRSSDTNSLAHHPACASKDPPSFPNICSLRLLTLKSFSFCTTCLPAFAVLSVSMVLRILLASSSFNAPLKNNSCCQSFLSYFWFEPWFCTCLPSVYVTPFCTHLYCVCNSSQRTCAPHARLSCYKLAVFFLNFMCFVFSLGFSLLRGKQNWISLVVCERPHWGWGTMIGNNSSLSLIVPLCCSVKGKILCYLVFFNFWQEIFPVDGASSLLASESVENKRCFPQSMLSAPFRALGNGSWFVSLNPKASTASFVFFCLNQFGNESLTAHLLINRSLHNFPSIYFCICFTCCRHAVRMGKIRAMLQEPRAATKWLPYGFLVEFWQPVEII